MNNKALATMIVAILLIGTLGLTLNFPFKANAGLVYYTLTIDYAPHTMPVPLTAPTVGAHQETEGSTINITAPVTVSGGSGIQYVFANWTFHDDTNNVTDGSVTSFSYTTSPLDRNWTCIAMYDVQYLFTVVTPYDTPWIWNGAAWNFNTTSMFIDAGAVVRAALSTGVVSLDGGAGEADFINWTGDATGTGLWSNVLTLTGPKTAIANWTVKYMLYTGTHDDLWGPSTGPFGTWVPAGTVVPLTAAQNNTASDLHYRWLFDHWDIQNYNGTAWNVVATDSHLTTNVLVDRQKYCIAQYKLQYYLVVTTSPSAILCGAESKTGWYYYGDNVTLTANQYVADPTDPMGTRWNFTWWWINTVLYTTNLTTTVQILNDYVAYAGYQKQFLVTIKTNPSSILGMPNVYFTGQGWYNAGDIATVTAVNTTFYTTPAHDAKYVFDQWYFEGDGYGTIGANVWGFAVNKAWNASALYHKEYLATAICDPVNTGSPGTVLNTWNGWPIAGYSVWCTENTLVGWSAGSGPVYGYPFYYVFDHWTVVNSSGTFQMPKATSAFNLNVSGPQTTTAHYTGVSSFFTTPLTIVKTEPQYGNTFEVNVTAANLVDLYACDFNVTWNPAYLQLTSAVPKVADADMWGTTALVVMNTIDNINGNYHFVGTQSGLGSVGFNGTHTIVRLTFKIIYDPCYLTPYYAYSVIQLTGPAFSYTYPLLSDHHGNAMFPTNVYSSQYYNYAVQPTLYMKPSTVTASSYGATFSVEIWIKNITNLDDWHTWVYYDHVLLQVTGVTIDTGFLTEPLSRRVYDTTTYADWIGFDVQQDSAASLANGTGRLATIYFKVIKSIFWTTANPILTCNIHFSTSTADTWISQYHANSPLYRLVKPTDLALGNCVYTYQPIPGDLNMDGQVNSLDLQLVAADYGSSTTYDLNVSGKVDLLDIVLVAINYGRTSP